MKELLNKRGSSTLELLIAFGLITMFIGSMVLVSFGNQNVLLDSVMNIEALNLSRIFLEETRSKAHNDFSAINPRKYKINDIYENELLVKQTDLWTKEIFNQVSWNINGKKMFSTLSSIVVDKDGFDGGDTCSSIVSNDWQKVDSFSYDFGKDLVFDESNEFLLTDIDVRNKKMYISVEGTTSNNSATFFVFDLSTDPPNFITGLDNNPKVKSGINAIHIGTNYAYLASNHKSNFATCEEGTSCSQLQIVDLKNNIIISKMKMPGVIGSGGQAIGNSIFYKNGLVYLGLSKSSVGPEFHIIDVGNGVGGGTPSNPVHLSSFNIGNGVNKIFVKNGYAFIASPNEEELKILDVKDPTHIYQKSGFDAPQGKNNFGNGKSVVVIDNRVYLGRTLLSDGDEFYTFDINDGVSELSSLKSENILNLNKSNVSVNDIIIKDFFIFLLTNNDFRIIDSNNDQQRILYSSPSSFSAKDMDCEDDIFYISETNNLTKSFITIIKPK